MGESEKALLVMIFLDAFHWMLFLIVAKKGCYLYFFSPDTHLGSGGSRQEQCVTRKMCQGRGPQRVTTKTIVPVPFPVP